MLLEEQNEKNELLERKFRKVDSELLEVRNSAIQTRSSWLNCALRDDEAVYRVSIGHYEAVAVGN